MVSLAKPEEVNLSLGQNHLIKTAEDLHLAIVSSVPRIASALDNGGGDFGGHPAWRSIRVRIVDAIWSM